MANPRPRLHPRRASILVAAVVAVCASIASVGIALGSGTAHAESPGTAFNQPCAQYTLIAARGSGEGTDRGMLQDHVVKYIKFPNAKFRVHWIGYPAFLPAGAGDLPQFRQSIKTGIEMTQSTISYYVKQCPSTRFILAGYSQGAQVMGDVASLAAAGGQNRPTIDANKIVGVFLLADPRRNRNFRPTLGKQGGGDGIMHWIMAPRTFGKLDSRTTEYCAEHDPVCDAGNSPSALNRMRAEVTKPGPHTSYSSAMIPGTRDKRNTYTAHMAQDIIWVVRHEPAALKAKY